MTPKKNEPDLSIDFREDRSVVLWSIFKQKRIRVTSTLDPTLATLPAHICALVLAHLGVRP